MKIVIDIPEEVAEWFKERAFIPIKYYTEVEEAMGKAEPLSEILDKISGQTAGVPYHFWDDEAYVKVYDIREIIERLKGGNDG